jgi:hypothetical protein
MIDLRIIGLVPRLVVRTKDCSILMLSNGKRCKLGVLDDLLGERRLRIGERKADRGGQENLAVVEAKGYGWESIHALTRRVGRTSPICSAISG